MTKYWFRRRKGLFSKDLGWGWIPISIEGWLVIVATLAIIVGSFFLLGVRNGDYIRGLGFLGLIIVLILVSGAISEYKTKRE
jgi:hypothetical protein